MQNNSKYFYMQTIRGFLAIIITVQSSEARVINYKVVTICNSICDQNKWLIMYSVILLSGKKAIQILHDKFWPILDPLSPMCHLVTLALTDPLPPFTVT